MRALEAELGENYRGEVDGGGEEGGAECCACYQGWDEGREWHGHRCSSVDWCVFVGDRTADVNGKLRRI